MTKGVVMERLKGKKPSPAMVVSIIGLVFALAGSAMAGVATISVLSKKEKKQVRTIAKDEISKTAPGLSVASANMAANANLLQGQPASAFASSQSEAYHEVGAPGEPQFENGWANFDSANFSTAGFYKDPFGVVHLKGTLVNATDNSIAFQLPPGYRPSKQHLMPMGSEAPNPFGVPVPAKLEVESDGEVRPDCDGAGCASAGIDGLTFRAP